MKVAVEEAKETFLDPQEKMVALHRATLSLFSDLSLEGVLNRVLHAAMELAQARYAALGIPDGKGGLETFLTLGMDEDEMVRIPHPPEGKGLIGEILRSGNSLRIPVIADHPKSAGFPPGHPPMTSFLGVPIAAYGRPIGQLYLTEKIGAKAFSSEDQRLIEMLAAHAAAAIENARLYQQVLKSEAELAERNQELGLMNSLATAVSSNIELNQLLEIMLERVMDLYRADAGEIFLREEDQEIYRKAIHKGEAPEAFWENESFHPGEGFIGAVAQSKQPRWTTNLGAEVSFLRRSVVDSGFKTLLCVPLTAPGKVVGVLSMAFKGQRPFDTRALALVEAVGAGVGVAVENARLYRQARRLAVLEERERIGMDLHDGIIQSIYAVGLTLENSRMLVKNDPGGTIERLAQAIDGLNEVIRDLRNYILDLQPTRMPSHDIDKALRQLVLEFKANTLVDAELHVEDSVAGLFRDHTASELYLLAQEALANAAKHAHASRVLVSLRQTDDAHVALQIIDNGRGFDANAERPVLGHGLSNMAERARAIGGEFAIDSSPGEGTTVTVRVPAPRPAAQ